MISGISGGMPTDPGSAAERIAKACHMIGPREAQHQLRSRDTNWGTYEAGDPHTGPRDRVHQRDGDNTPRSAVLAAPLPGFEDLAPPPRRALRPVRIPRFEATEPLILTFAELAGATGLSPRTVVAYVYQVRTVLALFERETGRTPSWSALFADAPQLGRLLTDDRSLAAGPTLVKHSLGQRRRALKSFVRLMSRHLADHLQGDPGLAVDAALRAVSTRVGTRYKLPGGRASSRARGMPTPEEAALLIATAARAPGHRGPRNGAFLALLETGARVNALLELDGDDVLPTANGQLQIRVHEKGHIEKHPVLLSRRQTDLLLRYFDDVQARAAALGRVMVIGVGVPGRIWRDPRGRSWSHGDVCAVLERACLVAETAHYRPHAFRRMYATEAASYLERQTVADAVGWRDPAVGDLYINPRHAVIAKKLREDAARALAPLQQEASNVAAKAVRR